MTAVVPQATGRSIGDMTARRVRRALLALALAVPIAYLAAIGVEASHRLVNQHTRSGECRIPAHVGLAYEAINYDVVADAALLDEPDPWDCVGAGAPAGDELVTEDGVRLAGWYIPATGDIGPDGPTVILSHGWTGNKGSQLDEALMFVDRANVVLFDFRNHGQSQDAVTTQGIHEQRDLSAVIDWVVGTKGASEIILAGQSMGGHTTVNVAADDPRVDAVVLEATHPRVMLPMANRIEQDYPFGGPGAVATVLATWFRTGVNVASDDPIEAIDDLGDRPLLLVAAGSDDTIPVDEIEAMGDRALAAGVDARFEVCPEAEHHLVVETCPTEYQRWVDGLLDTVLDR